jgi:hypothetical protein
LGVTYRTHRYVISTYHLGLKPKRDEVTGACRKLHNEELHNVYSSPSIIRMIKPRRIIWAGHVARMMEKRNVYRVLVGRQDVFEWTILKRILER